MSEPREQILECRKYLYAAKNEHTMHSLLLVCQLELSIIDRKLRTCRTEELQALQGEVKVWEKLRKYVQDDPDIASGS